MPIQMRLLILIPLLDDLSFEEGRRGGWAISSYFISSTSIYRNFYSQHNPKVNKNYCGAQVIIFT